jgi:hypothetical protein
MLHKCLPSHQPLASQQESRAETWNCAGQLPSTWDVVTHPHQKIRLGGGGKTDPDFKIWKFAIPNYAKTPVKRVLESVGDGAVRDMLLLLVLS